MPAVPGGRPARPRRPAPGPDATAPGNGEGAHEVTARTTPRPSLPVFPSGRDGPPASPASQRACGAPSFPRSPGRPPRAADCRRPRGTDLTRPAERSVRRHDPTDGPPPGTQTAPARSPATPGNDPGTPGDPLLTIEEVTAELRVSRAAFYRWRRRGAGPSAVRLPGCGSGAAR
jgi:hypothetical protein